MNTTQNLIVRWGCIIGITNLAWLYLSYYLGLHTNGLALFQIVPIGWLLITLVGFFLALRRFKQQSPHFTYWDGLRNGLLVALITALIAVVMQVGYHTLVFPGWPEYMVEQTRAYFSASGLSGTALEAKIDEARQTFTLSSYAMQSALSALFGGGIISAIMMIFLQRKTA